MRSLPDALPSTVSRIAAVLVQVAAAAVVLLGDAGELWTLPLYGVAIIAVPSLVGRLVRYTLEPLQRVWFSAGLAVHPVGAVYDLYHAVPWYDNLAHLASASLLAGLAYLLAAGLGGRGSVRRIGPGTHIAVLATIALVGVGWELFELQVQYLHVPGPEDTLADLSFDLVGWLLVAPRWNRLLARLPDRLARRLHGTPAAGG